MGNMFTKNAKCQDETPDQRDSSPAPTIPARAAATPATTSPPISSSTTLAADHQPRSLPPVPSPTPAHLLPMRRPPRGASFLAPVISSLQNRRLDQQFTSSGTQTDALNEESSDDSDEDDAPVTTRQLRSSRQSSSTSGSTGPSGSGSAGSSGSPIAKQPLYGTGLMSPQAAFFKSLRSTLPGSYAFMTVFLQGAHLHFENDEVPVHYHADGRNYKQLIGDLKEIHVFHNMDGLDMKVPKDLSISTMPRYINPGIEVGVNDSQTQNRMNMTVGELIKEFRKEVAQRSTILNNLTTLTDGQLLDRHLQLPAFVREHSMLDKLEEALKKQPSSPKITDLLKKIPKYQKFLFLSLKGCFTDGHIDMASTSVYSHIHEGEKHFFFAKNTPENIEVFKNYEKDFYNYSWIGELLAGQWRRVILKKGTTIFIPGSYIHFVWTPKDTIMIGGNFFMEKNLEQQFDIAKFEEEKYAKRLQETGENDRSHLFPHFPQLMWAYAEFVLIPRLQNYQNATDTDHLLSMTAVFLKELKPTIESLPYREQEMKNLKERMKQMVQEIKSERRKRSMPSTSGPAPAKKSKK
ncbi:hypothetical protein CAEBREN_11666 [Caenorhabditis brenneri]|uniref:JmjC domain-containing protein n=1 Tax=Caenorhabditis brenneri TaxID=135651 RepID=G0N655_CAEBE|nr:hypothetical protein CAEBREN_11666 [Caenorhabditis brenneri]